MFVSKDFRFIRLFKFNTETQVDERRTKPVSNDTGDLPVFKKGHAHGHTAFTCAHLALVDVYEFKGSLEHDPLRTHVGKLAACKGVLQNPLCTPDRHLRT